MNGISAYKQNAVATENKGRLVVMLYDGAIKFLRQAVEALEREDYVEKGRLINRAIDIIEELNVTLDMEVGGEIAQNLRNLYYFMGKRLTEANVKRSAKMIEEVIDLLEDLNSAWRQIAT